MDVDATVSLGLVPRAGVEPARPYGQRILSPGSRHLPGPTKRYQAIFTDVSAVKASKLASDLVTNGIPLIFPSS